MEKWIAIPNSIDFLALINILKKIKIANNQYMRLVNNLNVSMNEHGISYETLFLSEKEVFMGLSELQQKEPEFYNYLAERSIKIEINHFPFHKYTGQRYVYYPELQIAPAEYYLYQKNNDAIERHTEQAKLAQAALENATEKYFKLNTNACARNPIIKEVVAGLNFASGSGIGSSFTLEGILKDRKRLADFYNIPADKYFSIVIIEDIPQLLFGSIKLIKSAHIDSLEKEYIIKLRKATFDQVMEKTEGYIKKISGISQDLKERAMQEGMLTNTEICDLIRIIYSKINGHFFSLLHKKEDAQGEILLQYLRLLEESNLQDPEIRKMIIERTGEEFFKNPELYHEYYSELKAEMKAVETMNFGITPLAQHYLDFSKMRKAEKEAQQVSFEEMTEENPVVPKLAYIHPDEIEKGRQLRTKGNNLLPLSSSKPLGD